MASATAVLYGVNRFDGRVADSGACRRAARFVATNIMLAIAALATVGVLGICATLAAAWIVNSTLGGNPRIHATAPMGPATLALVQPDPTLVREAIAHEAIAHEALAHEADAGFAAKWAQMAGLIVVPRPIAVRQKNETAQVIAPAAKPIQIAKLTPPALPAPERNIIVPLPRAQPAQLQRRPAEVIHTAPAPKAAVVPPPAVAKPVAPVEAHNKAPVEADSRTALYDIAGHTVYMPNGEKLEAHSGLYDDLDDPRYVHVRMRGPTPPNVYDLTLRGELFHGVRAIRLNPVDENKMFGRAGMLAHTYMLGPNGQSNGCVSFKDYRKFLTAFLNGEVDRLVVVPALGKTPWRAAVAQRTQRRYAENN
jgi:hypothetical protein